MRLYRQKRQRGIADGITGIAPIYKVSLEGNVDLIGTGFWITEKGHLVTAWHVIADNIGKDGETEDRSMRFKLMRIVGWSQEYYVRATNTLCMILL
jgi:hypothetical protein